MTVFFEGLQIHGHHGVPPEERVIGHRYSLDLRMELGDEPKGDGIAQTVDYVEAMRFVEKVSGENRFETVERLAQTLSDGLMERFPTVTTLELKVSKLMPPAPHIVERVGVIVNRTRS